MRYLVIGPGALGCLFAALLAKGSKGGSDEIWLMDHRRDRADLINRRGLTYERDNRCEEIPIRTGDSPDAVVNADILIFCVKSYDLATSLTQWQPLLEEGVLAIFLQNGISHLHIHEATAQSTPVFGTCSEGATLVTDGHVRHCGTGTTYLGFLDTEPDGTTPQQLELVSRYFNKCGLTTSISQKINERLWAKLFVNIGINALTGIYRISNGGILESEELTHKMTTAIHEACLVAQANGIAIHEDPVQAAINVCKATAQNTSSMLQDIRKNKRTEIEAINGAIVREGERLGIKTPVNTELFSQIKAIEEKYNPGTNGLRQS